MTDRIQLLVRKVAVAFGVGAGAVVVIKAGPVIDGVEHADWPTVADTGKVLLFGAVAGGLRALVALLTAWVPTDAQVGLNLLGKFRR